MEEVGEALVDRLPVFVQSGDLEVQERVSHNLCCSDVIQYVSNCYCVMSPIVLWHYYINDYVIVVVTQACCILQLMKYIVKLQSKG